jgi:hypothetical protein
MYLFFYIASVFHEWVWSCEMAELSNKVIFMTQIIYFSILSFSTVYFFKKAPPPLVWHRQPFLCLLWSALFTRCLFRTCTAATCGSMRRFAEYALVRCHLFYKKILYEAHLASQACSYCTIVCRYCPWTFLFLDVLQSKARDPEEDHSKVAAQSRFNAQQAGFILAIQNGRLSYPNNGSDDFQVDQVVCETLVLCLQPSVNSWLAWIAYSTSSSSNQLRGYRAMWQPLNIIFWSGGTSAGRGRKDGLVHTYCACA